MQSLTQAAFGGNIADYRGRTEAIEGVGSCKVFPAWDGGGTVRLVITSAEEDVPEQALIEAVQEKIDPPGFQGEGKGIAPIGHVVTVAGVTGVSVDIRFKLEFEPGYSWENLQPQVREAIDMHFQELISQWASSEHIVVREAQIKAAVVGVTGIEDIEDVTINGASGNLILDEECIPILKEVQLNA